MRHLRSLLFAPAVRPDMFAKLPSRGADAVIIDLEDGVPIDRKIEARTLASSHIPALVEAGCTVFVRVNACDTQWFDDDIEEALIPGITGILVPKVETFDGLDYMALRLEYIDGGDVAVVVGIETALGVADARNTLTHPRLSAAYFGAEDFVADLGGARTDTNAEVAHARAAVAIAARVGQLVAFDQVVTKFDDDDRFRREAAEARALGYVGKMCIHPSQVSLANEAFSPSLDEVATAGRLVKAYEAGVAQGQAAIDFEGRMVDEPLASQARRMLDLAAAHGIEGGGAP